MESNENKNLNRRGRIWYVRFMVNGTIHNQSLFTDDVYEARIRRDEYMADYKNRDAEARFIKRILLRKQILEEEERQSAKNKGTKISGAFKKFVASAAYRMDCKPEQMALHELHWTRFQAWLNIKFPKIQHCNEITKDIARQWLNHLKTMVGSPNTYNKHKSSIHYILETIRIVDDSSLANPLEGVHAMKEENENKRPFTEDELWAIFAVNNYEWQLLAAVGLYTSLRFNSARMLKWENYDGTILHARHDKTDKDATQVVCENLKYWLDKTPPEKRHGLMFPTFGTLPKAKAVKRVTGFLNLAGITETQKATLGMNGKIFHKCVVGFHSFRHTAITMAEINGATGTQVEQWAGHSSRKMREKYTHFDAIARGKVASRINRFW